jgi:hypothetical protein
MAHTVAGGSTKPLMSHSQVSVTVKNESTTVNRTEFFGGLNRTEDHPRA